MQDSPTPAMIVAAVTAFLRDRVLPEVSGRTAFDLRVSINALELVGRQLVLAPAAEREEAARLTEWLGTEGDLAGMNADLAAAIADGRIDGADPVLIDHLRRTTLEKLAVDQPKYAAYRRAIEERD